MKSDCLVKRFLQTKDRRTDSARFVTPSNQHHCFTFQNTIVFYSPIEMLTHPMIHSFIACRILENGVGMIHWDSLSFRWSFEMGCVWPSWILQHLHNCVVDSIDSMVISFLWSEWGVKWVCQTLWHCGSEGAACCWMNATPWKQNGISIWVCVARLIVTSCDVESIDEFVCERKWSVDSALFSWSPPITWVWERNHVNLLFLGFSIPIHSASLLYHLHRLALESRNCNHHHSFPFSSNCNPYSIHCLISIKWTHSNSSQWSLFNRIPLILFPFSSPCNDSFWCTIPHPNQ